jgi:hypothetical protein
MYRRVLARGFGFALAVAKSSSKRPMEKRQKVMKCASIRRDRHATEKNLMTGSTRRAMVFGFGSVCLPL